MNKKKYFIYISNLNIAVIVSIRTYYKIFNNEIGILNVYRNVDAIDINSKAKTTIKEEQMYEVDLEVIKKYKRIYNTIRRM